MGTMRIEKKTTRGYIILGVWRFIELICILEFAQINNGWMLHWYWVWIELICVNNGWMLHWYWVWISNAWYHKRLSLKIISRESSIFFRVMFSWNGKGEAKVVSVCNLILHRNRLAIRCHMHSFTIYIPWFWWSKMKLAKLKYPLIILNIQCSRKVSWRLGKCE